MTEKENTCKSMAYKFIECPGLESKCCENQIIRRGVRRNFAIYLKKQLS